METEFLEEYINNPALQAKYGNFSEYRDFMGSQQPVEERGIQNIIGSNLQNFQDNVSQGLGYLKNKGGEGWDFAKQIPGMAMGALGGMPGAAMNLLSKLAKPDTPYQTFQKQMFEDMGWQGESNKDPWGKNINSAFGDYDVTEQWGDLMGTKIGEKYGYADAMADGVIDDAELAKMQDLGLKGWQLNRAIGLSTAAKKAQAWQDKKAQEKILTNQMTNTGGGGYKPGDATTNWNPNIKGTTSFHPSQGNTGGGSSWSPAGKSPSQNKGSSYSRGSYAGRGHHWAKGGRVGYADGGLATLFARRG